MKPLQSMISTKLYEISRWRSNHFQKRGITVSEFQLLLQTITVPEVHLDMNQQVNSENDDKSTESSDVMAHKYR
jgi:hypothetical protein